MTSAEYQFLEVETTGGVAVVTINRPAHLNTLSSAAHRELEDLWPDLQERDEVDAVVLTGAGGVFGAGGDVKEMLERVRAGVAGSGISTARARRLVHGILDFEKPVVAAVEGRAFGLSATIALLCDVVVASSDAVFGDPHVAVGLVPGDGGAAVWCALVGPQRARAVLMRGAVVDAGTLAGWGAVAEVVDPGQALARGRVIAAELAAGPRIAVRGTKIAVNAYVRAQMAPVLETSLAHENRSLTSSDFRAALEALAEKRSPVFTDPWGV